MGTGEGAEQRRGPWGYCSGQHSCGMKPDRERDGVVGPREHQQGERINHTLGETTQPGGNLLI